MSAMHRHAARRPATTRALRAWAIGLVFALIAPLANAATTDPLAGALTIVGSDTITALVLRWSDAFRQLHPDVRVQIQAQGSASAPIALLEGAADIGMMSRPMSADEAQAFRRRFGYAPTRVAVAHDAIVVFVHPDNPLEAITRRQLDAIYSSTLRCGGAASVTRWDALGAAGEPAAHILANGRNGASGTSEFFRETALCGGDYRPDVVVWPGHGATVAAVAGNREAIGYAGIGYVNGLVKPLAYAPDDHGPAVAAVMENVMNGDYALSRLLYLYANQPPDRAPAALPAAFLRYVLSESAQALIAEEGFLPLAPAEREAESRLIRATMPP